MTTERVQLYTGKDACKTCDGYGSFYDANVGLKRCSDCLGTGHRDPAAEMARLRAENAEVRRLDQLPLHSPDGPDHRDCASMDAFIQAKTDLVAAREELASVKQQIHQETPRLWKCLDCKEEWSLERRFEFSYCPKCYGGHCIPAPLVEWDYKKERDAARLALQEVVDERDALRAVCSTPGGVDGWKLWAGANDQANAARADAEKAWALVEEVVADITPPADEWQRQWLAKVEQAKRERGK